MRIRALSSDGAGVGNLDDGRVVFVPRTAPGDEVRVCITHGKPRWARGSSVKCAFRLRTGFPLPVGITRVRRLHVATCRIRPAAPLEGRHRERGAQAHFARDIGLPEVVPSPKEQNYRSRVTFTLIRLPGGRVVAGFHHLAVPHRIVDVEEGCILPEPAVASVWTGLRRAWGEGARRLPAGRKLRLTLRAVDEGVILVVEGGRGPGRPDILLREVEGLVAVWAERPKGGGRLLAGQTHVHDTRFGETVRSGPTTFLQVNRGASEALHRWVVEHAAGEGGEKVVDAYCGVGLYGRDLARSGADVLGIERDSEAARAASRDAPESFTVWTGAVEDRMAEALPADLVVLNPPRKGVDARVTEALQAAGPPRLIYVSCDPATLARDIGRLSSSYEVVNVRAFDFSTDRARGGGRRAGADR